MLMKKDPNLRRKEERKKRTPMLMKKDPNLLRKKKKKEKTDADVEATSQAAVEEAGLPDETQVNREAAAGEEAGSPPKKVWRTRAKNAETNVKADVDETAEAVTDPYIVDSF